MDFKFVWFFCRFSGTLSDEQDAAVNAVTAFNEAHAVTRGELLGYLTCNLPRPGMRRAVEENIAMSSAFVLIAEDIWDAPPASFAAEFKLALKHQADPAMPMRHLALFFRRPRTDEDSDGRMAAFRQSEPASAVPQFDFVDGAELRTQFDRLLDEWFPGV